ncbi:MAG: cation transporter [Lachnospiraceae bacterium]|nr:cation transporter [Lachnospiraceae bacterium]
MNQEEKMLNRKQIIIKTSVTGIVTNVLLATFKAIIGILTHSIAIVLDAVNNLSDALSSVLTIIGAKLAGKSPDKKHPLGYGRIEYLSSMAVSAIVLYAGLTSLTESVKKILHPQKAEYTLLSLVIIAVAVLVKLALGFYVKKQGELVKSGALTASGSDALFDAVLSTSVLASAILYMFAGISLEAFVGVLIAVIIIKAGIEMMMDTVDDILGKRADAEVSNEIKRLLREEPEIRGAYDLMINNYGPGKNYASVHIELPDTMTVEEVDRITRKAERKVFLATGIILTGVGVYSYNTQDDEAARIRNDVQKRILSHDWALQIHGFYVDQEQHYMRFDTVIGFEIESEKALSILHKEISEAYPGYEIQIVADVDLSD